MYIYIYNTNFQITQSINGIFFFSDTLCCQRTSRKVIRTTLRKMRVNMNSINSFVLLKIIQNYKLIPT